MIFIEGGIGGEKEVWLLTMSWLKAQIFDF